jgi:hypothetical protein
MDIILTKHASSLMEAFFWYSWYLTSSLTSFTEKRPSDFFAPNAIVLALGATSHLLSAVPSIDASKPVNTIPMRP